MGVWWFGRKAAPPDVRPFVPAWLTTAEAEEGFARSVEGMMLYDRASAVWTTYQGGAWELGCVVRGSSLVLGGQQVVGSRAAAIASASGGAIVDAQARAVVDQILAALRQHGLIET